MTGEDGQIEAGENGHSAAAGWLEDLRDSLTFLTRLPVPQRHDGLYRPLSRAVRGFPLAGAIIGAISGLALLAAQGAGLPAPIAACLAVLAGVLATGGLHEDGLADVADGFGSGGSKERKLEVMRDSRTGTYGVLALVFAVILKITCLATLFDGARSVWHVPLILVAVGAVSRTFIVMTMQHLPAARSDGNAVAAGVPLADAGRHSLLIGAAIGVVLIWTAGGLWSAAAALIAGFVAYMVLKRRAMLHIGGQTGDVLGAMQQTTEISMLLALAATYP